SREIAFENLTKPHIQNRIHELRIQTGKNFNITRERLAQELALIAFGDTKILFNDKGELKTPDEWSDEGRIISAVEETTTTYSYDNGNTSEKKIKKIKQW